MKLSIMEIMLIADTLRGSLEIVNGYGRNFNFSDEDRQKVLNRLTNDMNNTYIILDGSTGEPKK